jgi:pimeloyl-ACP methyl ester carboxylesterase
VRFNHFRGAVLACLVLGRVSAAEPTVGTFDAKGVKIRYMTQGSGEPVVLIHGLHASAATNWQLPGIFDALAKDHQVIALDLPGHGGSDKPDDVSAYGAQMAEDVVLLMDHLKVPKAHVVGYSLGGMITIKLLTLHPDRVLSAVVGGMGWVRAGGRNNATFEGMGPQDGSPHSPVVRSMGKLAVTEADLKAIKVPVTVIVGTFDPVYRVFVDPLKSARPDWPVVNIAGVGHILCIYKADFREAIRSWLEKNREK